MPDPPVHLDQTERRCLQHFLTILRDGLGPELLEVWLFGSFARGDAWSRRMPINSDIDLLVITANEIAPEIRESLLNETDPLYLGCGRQISPQFWSERKFDDPPSGKAKGFKTELLREGKRVLPENPDHVSE